MSNQVIITVVIIMPPAIKVRDVLKILQGRLRDMAVLQEQTVKEFSYQMSKINNQITEVDNIMSSILQQGSDELDEPLENQDIDVKRGEREKISTSFPTQSSFELYMATKLSENVLKGGLASYFPDWVNIRKFLKQQSAQAEVSNSENDLNDDFLAPAEKKKVVRFSSTNLEDKHKIPISTIVNGIRTLRKNRNTKPSQKMVKLTSSESLSDRSDDEDDDDVSAAEAAINEEAVVNGTKEIIKRTDNPSRSAFLEFLSRMWLCMDFDVFGKGDDTVKGLRPSDVQEVFALYIHSFLTADLTSIGLANPIQFDQRLEEEILLPTQTGNE